MSSQRELKTKSLPLNTVAGVNEREHDTELPLYLWSLQEGLFPEFTGLQSRLWGKRLLQKFANPVYGIHQFWTPQGYGVGLYQFQSSLDFGYWLTPTSRFNLARLDYPITGGGYSADDFGPTGFGYGTEDACLLSFLNGGTEHTVCNDPAKGKKTPNDGNGGPAGQGRNCTWQNVVEDVDLIDFVVSQQAGTISNTVTLATTLNCRNDPAHQPPCVPYPALPTPLGVIPEISVFSIQIINGILSAAKTISSFTVFVPATIGECDFDISQGQNNFVTNNKVTVNLSTIVDAEIDTVHLVVVKTPGGEVEVEIPITEVDFLLNANDYLTLGSAVLNGVNQGYDQSGSVVASTLRLRSRRRICA